MKTRSTSQSSLAELKELWKAEQEDYKKSEVGSGVQSFVWDVFQSPDLFNLKRGLKSTADHSRKGEFLLEESNKGGQADAVIFMDSEVVIPVEVEKFEKAQSGEWQILKYRTAFDKKYGILTDGYEWRFYYGDIENKQHYKFTIDEIFEDPTRFRTFWDEYVKPKNYYLSFFEQLGQQKMEFFDQRLMVDEHRERFFEDVTDIIRKLKDKLLNAGFFRSIKDEKEREKKATEIAYSYLIQFILYKTLVDNKFDAFEEEFAKKSELIHQNLKRESFNSVLMILEGMSGKISENIYKPFHSEQAAILEQVKDILHSGEDNIMSVAPFLDIFVFIKKYQFADVQNDIFGAIYENYLKELYEEQQLGQYFTDPDVVNFMLEEIGYDAAEIKKRGHENISIIDPSCGSGTFLYSAVREIVKARDFSKEEESKKIEQEVLNNVFGLDIAEFPLYLAEMSILMKMLPLIISKKYNNPINKKLKLFVTEDSVAEFIGEVGGRGAGGNDSQMQFALPWQYEGFMRDERDLDEMKNSLKTLGGGEKTIPRRRFDFVIGNPPYISYLVAAKQGVRIFKMIKEKNAQLSDIYGVNLHSAPGKRKKYAPTPNLYAFFIALGLALLKEDGKLCFIIPQTVLVNSVLDVIRYYLASNTTIEKIIIFSGKMFIGRGIQQKTPIATSSLVFVASRKMPSKKHSVEVINYLDPKDNIADCFENIRSGKKISKGNYPQTQLLEHFANWNYLTSTGDFLSIFHNYEKNSESFSAYYQHNLADKNFGFRFFFDRGLKFPKEKIETADQLKENEYSLPKIQKQKSWIEVTNKLIHSRYFDVPHGSQGEIVFRQKYKIVWNYMNFNGFYFSDQPIMIPFNWVLIASDAIEEMMYLFAVLNSALQKYIINGLFKVENEDKLTILLGIQLIKEQLRIPKITSDNKPLKGKVIKLTEKILEMEKQTITDLVELETLLQHFDDLRVKNSSLILQSGSKEVHAKIKHGAAKLVENVLDEHFGSLKLLPGERTISLSELKSLPAFDREAQDKIKEEIDDLVFDLYGVTKDERGLILRRTA